MNNMRVSHAPARHTLSKGDSISRFGNNDKKEEIKETKTWNPNTRSYISEYDPSLSKENGKTAASKLHQALIWLGTIIAATGVGGTVMLQKNHDNWKDNVVLKQELQLKELASKTESYKQHVAEKIKEQLQQKLALVQQAENLDKSVKELFSKIFNQQTLDQIPLLVEKVAPSTCRVEGSSGLGSGLFVKEKGKENYYLMTNGHVLEDNAIYKDGEDQYHVFMYNGSDYEESFNFFAKVAKGKSSSGKTVDTYSPKTDHDMALLEVPQKIVKQLLAKGIKPLKLRNYGEKPLKVGEFAMAIGNPMGLKDAVTAGILSNVNRFYQLEPQNKFASHDAAINPGNSGGGLFDWDGNVLGMNTLGRQGSDGSGAAIRVDVINDVSKTKWGIELEMAEKNEDLKQSSFELDSKLPLFDIEEN